MPGEKNQGDTRRLFAEERRRKILDAVSRDSHVLVNELSEQFGVSTATLRSDLRALEAENLLKRTHGGAVAVDAIAVEHSADQALLERTSAKQLIGRAAAELVHDGDTLFCDSGSTTVDLVRALTGRNYLTVITNDYTVAAEAERNLPNSSIVLLGGVLRNGFHYTMGAATVDSVSRLSASLAFIATSAFSFERGFSVHTLDLAAFKRKIIERADRSVVLMDSSKFDTFAMASYAELDDISALVTDSGISEKNRELIAANAPELEFIVAE